MQSRKRGNLAALVVIVVSSISLSAEDASARLDPCVTDSCGSSCSYTCGDTCSKKCTEEICYGTGGLSFPIRQQCEAAT